MWPPSNFPATVPPPTFSLGRAPTVVVPKTPALVFYSYSLHSAELSKHNLLQSINTPRPPGWQSLSSTDQDVFTAPRLWGKWSKRIWNITMRGIFGISAEQLMLPMNLPLPRKSQVMAKNAGSGSKSLSAHSPLCSPFSSLQTAETQYQFSGERSQRICVMWTEQSVDSLFHFSIYFFVIRHSTRAQF